MGGVYDKVKILDDYTGIEDTFICMVIFLLVVLSCFWYDSLSSKRSDEEIKEEEEEDEAEPPRNFTIAQLRYFDGKKDPKNPEEDKGLYLSIQGKVFDVNKGREFYGPGSPYENFAGRECGIALAKFSFDEEHLDDIDGCENGKLSWFEKEELHNWIEKFSYYRNYPEKGRLVSNNMLPSSDRIISKEELELNNGVVSVAVENNDDDDDGNNNGKKENTNHIPDGYATAPIYVALRDKVFDVSFGGVVMYGPGGPYHRFAGKDLSRALAKMSFDPKDLENTDITDLTEKEINVLDDWCTTFEEKKLYPIVGRLQK